jgi:hypothetical protein
MVLGQYVRFSLVSLFRSSRTFPILISPSKNKFSLNLANPNLKPVPILFINKSNKGNGAINARSEETLPWNNSDGINARYLKGPVCKMRNHKHEPAAPRNKLPGNWNFLPACPLTCSAQLYYLALARSRTPTSFYWQPVRANTLATIQTGMIVFTPLLGRLQRDIVLHVLYTLDTLGDVIGLGFLIRVLYKSAQLDRATVNIHIHVIEFILGIIT